MLPACVSRRQRATIMSVQFLLFVIAILLFAIFWELCKINSRLKKGLPAQAGTTETLKSSVRGEANGKATA
jgi:hypothetical protein